MIDEKTLIEHFNNMSDKCNLFRWRSAKKIKEGLAHIIRTQPKVGGWIPCSERLPEIGQMCLCSVNYKKYTDVPYDIILCKYEERYINRWADWYTAWMPLPAPFEQKEKQ